MANIVPQSDLLGQLGRLEKRWLQVHAAMARVQAVQLIEPEGEIFPEGVPPASLYVDAEGRLKFGADTIARLSDITDIGEDLSAIVERVNTFFTGADPEHVDTLLEIQEALTGLGSRLDTAETAISGITDRLVDAEEAIAAETSRATAAEVALSESVTALEQAVDALSGVSANMSDAYTTSVTSPVTYITITEGEGLALDGTFEDFDSILAGVAVNESKAHARAAANVLVSQLGAFGFSWLPRLKDGKFIATSAVNNDVVLTGSVSALVRDEHVSKVRSTLGDTSEAKFGFFVQDGENTARPVIVGIENLDALMLLQATNERASDAGSIGVQLISRVRNVFTLRGEGLTGSGVEALVSPAQQEAEQGVPFATRAVYPFVEARAISYSGSPHVAQVTHLFPVQSGALTASGTLTDGFIPGISGEALFARVTALAALVADYTSKDATPESVVTSMAAGEDEIAFIVDAVCRRDLDTDLLVPVEGGWVEVEFQGEATGVFVRLSASAGQHALVRHYGAVTGERMPFAPTVAPSENLPLDPDAIYMMHVEFPTARHVALSRLNPVSARIAASTRPTLEAVAQRNLERLLDVQSPAASGSLGMIDESLDGLSDVRVISPAEGQVLVYDATLSLWRNGSSGDGGATVLDDLTDVAISDPENMNVLTYNATASQWVSAPVPRELGDLNDVAEDVTPSVEGYLLTFDGEAKQWVSRAPIGSTSLVPFPAFYATEVFASSSSVHVGDVTISSDSGGLLVTLPGEDPTRLITDEAVTSEVSAEAALRLAADTALQAGIDNEATARAAGDAALQTSINNEATARAAGDTALQTGINDEATARAAAISAEASARAAAISDAITAERAVTDSSISSAIIAERALAQQYVDTNVADAYAAANAYTDTQITQEETARDSAITAAVLAESIARASAINTAIAALDIPTDTVTAAQLAQAVQGLEEEDVSIRLSVTNLTTSVEGISTELESVSDQVSALVAQGEVGQVQIAGELLGDGETRAFSSFPITGAIEFTEGALSKLAFEPSYAQLSAQIDLGSLARQYKNLYAVGGFVDTLTINGGTLSRSDSRLAFKGNEIYSSAETDSQITSAVSGVQSILSGVQSTVSEHANDISALETSVANILSNTDPAALDSLTEVVAAFQAADSSLNGAITSLSTSLSARITGVTGISGDDYAAHEGDAVLAGAESLHDADLLLSQALSGKQDALLFGAGLTLAGGTLNTSFNIGDYATTEYVNNAVLGVDLTGVLTTESTLSSAKLDENAVTLAGIEVSLGESIGASTLRGAIGAAEEFTVESPLELVDAVLTFVNPGYVTAESVSLQLSEKLDAATFAAFTLSIASTIARIDGEIGQKQDALTAGLGIALSGSGTISTAFDIADYATAATLSNYVTASDFETELALKLTASTYTAFVNALPATLARKLDTETFAAFTLSYAADLSQTASSIEALEGALDLKLSVAAFDSYTANTLMAGLAGKVSTATFAAYTLSNNTRVSAVELSAANLATDLDVLSSDLVDEISARSSGDSALQAAIDAKVSFTDELARGAIDVSSSASDGSSLAYNESTGVISYSGAVAGTNITISGGSISLADIVSGLVVSGHILETFDHGLVTSVHSSATDFGSVSSDIAFQSVDLGGLSTGSIF
jgi:predicted  nucleic acid-binding Zn-ribbon protein